MAVAVARVVYSAAWSAESELQPYWQLVEHSTVRMQGIKFRKAVVTLKGHRMFPPLPYLPVAIADAIGLVEPLEIDLPMRYQPSKHCFLHIRRSYNQVSANWME